MAKRFMNYIANCLVQIRFINEDLKTYFFNLLLD